MNRRLRLALLLAALAAAGPSAVSAQAVHAAQAQVTVAWFRVAPANRAQLEAEPAGLKTRLYATPSAQVQSCADLDVVLPDTLRLHSLFQRPPPLHS